MSDQPTPPKQPSARPPPQQAEVKRRSRISFIWILPVVAVLIGGYLAFTTLSTRGPEIVITFKTADGLTAGQTKVKHKAVELGTVSSIRLSNDLSHVIVHVRMTNEAAPYLTENARFWVVRPRLSVNDISGLETLISGGYIELDPGKKGSKDIREYTGLEDPPGYRSDEPGTTFVLEASRIGSLGTGSPVFYRDIVVGEVLGYHLPEGNGPISTRIFVRAPYDKWVRDGTHFWNASGINVDLGGGGVHVQLESLQAVLSGGVAFATPEDNRDTPSAKADTSFPLFQDEAAANAAGYKQRIPLVMYFRSSTAGLAVGSQVQLYGLQVGNVTDIRLELDPQQGFARVRVAVEVQPERLTAINSNATDNAATVLQRLVDHGMRGELVTTSYVTGAQAVSFEFPPDPPPAKISYDGKTPVLPTIDAGFSGIVTSLAAVAAKLDSIPFASIGNNANGALAALSGLVGGPEIKQALGAATGALVDVQGLVKRTDAGLSPLMRRLPDISADLQNAVNRASRLLGSVDTSYGGNSQFQRDLERLMAQFNDAARSVRLLVDFLDRHPEALIRGRTGQAADR